MVDLNGKPFGRANAGVDMTFDFPQLIAHAAKTRPLGAGAIIGSGTVSNKLDGGPGKPVAAGGVGYSCIAEQRMVETIETGSAENAVPALRRYGAHRDEGPGSGHSIFGAIEQTVESADEASRRAARPDRSHACSGCERWICLTHCRRMAGNNRWSNDRLYRAVLALQPGEFEAARTSFFPSIKATLNHILSVDLFYLDMMEEGGVGAAHLRPLPDFDDPARLPKSRRAFDRRLIDFCDG